MITKGTYLQNSQTAPLTFGKVEIFNTPQRRLKGEEVKEGVLCKTVCTGFCGTDYELMQMGKRSKLTSKFPVGRNRLINGHEGVVYVPSEDRFAIVLIRGGDSYDPTRYMDDESYFEYGCDKADGLMVYENFFNPDMLLPIPEKYIENGQIPLSIAKRLTFADPFACMIFQLERMEDLGAAHNFRLEIAKHKCSEEEARQLARNNIFQRVVIFGLGTTGMFIGDLVRQKYPNAHIVFVGRSKADTPKVQFALNKTQATYVENNYNIEQDLAVAIQEKLGGKATIFIGSAGTSIEHKIAFEYGVLGNNGIYNSFSLGPNLEVQTMPFGFKNHLIFGSINFRQVHMEQAIKLLCESNYDKIVEIFPLEDLVEDPLGLYERKIFTSGGPMKAMTIWAPELLHMNK